MCQSQPTPPQAHPNLPASSIVTLSQSPRVHALEVAGQISLEVSVCPWYHTPVSALGSVRDRQKISASNRQPSCREVAQSRRHLPRPQEARQVEETREDQSHLRAEAVVGAGG